MPRAHEGLGRNRSRSVNGIGNGYRNIAFVNYRSSSTRANGDTDFPDPLEVTLGTMRLSQLNKKMWQTKMGRSYELISTTPDAAFGRENGVYVLNYVLNLREQGWWRLPQLPTHKDR